MIVKWTPQWYELDQSIVVGDVDWFYLTKEARCFATGLSEDKDWEVKGKIVAITHPELGHIKGILAIGLDYSIYLNNGEKLIVNAEEAPGRLEDSRYAVTQWEFQVHLAVIEKTGLTSKERLQLLTTNQRKEQQQ